MPASTPSATPALPGMIDARERVTGRVPYVMDVACRGCFTRSCCAAVPRMRGIVRVDRQPRTCAPGRRGGSHRRGHGRPRSDIRLLRAGLPRPAASWRSSKVRFVGEPVVAVAAVDVGHGAGGARPDRGRVRGAAGRLRRATRRWPTARRWSTRSRRVLGPTFADVILHAEAGTNLCNHFKLRKGDVEAGFAEASTHVFEDVFTSPPVQHVPLETHVCVAQVVGDHMTIWASTQIPYMRPLAAGRDVPAAASRRCA